MRSVSALVRAHSTASRPADAGTSALVGRKVLTIAESTAALGGREQAQLNVLRYFAQQGAVVTLLRRDVGELEDQWASFAEVVTVPERAAWHVNGPAGVPTPSASLGCHFRS